MALSQPTAVTLQARQRRRLLVRAKGKATGTAADPRVRLEQVVPETVAFAARPGIRYRLPFTP
jgi:hypothetical protein